MRIPARLLPVVGLIFATGLVVSGQGSSFQQQTRDPRQGPTSGTAAIAGQIVTDESSPQPVRRARVSISNTETQMSRTAYTDDAGKFVVSGLPAGRYSLAATRAGFVRAVYGAKRPDRAGTPITLAEGQPTTAIVLKMPRGSVITGIVTDPAGQPVPGVNVRLMQYRTVNGERQLAPLALATGFAADTTDDRGSYRLYGLPAGDYVVTASPRNAGDGDVRQMTPSEIQAAIRALSQPPVPAGTKPQPTPMADAVTVGYAPVFFPGTTLAANASTVTVAVGEERAGVDFALQLVRTARVEGQVITPDGVAPQNVQLYMTPSGASSGGLLGSFSLNRVTPGPDGKFTYTGVAPGLYTISARAAGRGPGDAGPAPVPGGGAGRGSAGAVMSLWAAADVTVEGQNLSGVMLTLQPGMSVSGRVAIVAVGADPPADLSRTRISLTPVGTSGISVGIASAAVDANGRFTLTGVTPGKYRFAGGLSSPEANWTMKGASAKGKDALDQAFEVVANENVADAVVTFTNQTQEISGALQDASGRPAPDFTIVVFPADKTYWTANRRIRTTRPGTDGKFVLKGLPAGAYRMAALTDMAPGDANDPSFLEQIVAGSIAITLSDGETKIQDLRIASGGEKNGG